MGLRLATVVDIPELNALARASEAHWGYREKELEAWRSDLEVAADLLRTRRAFVAEFGGQLAGFVQIATDASPWEIWGMWVRSSLIGPLPGTISFLPGTVLPPPAAELNC